MMNKQDNAMEPAEVEARAERLVARSCLRCEGFSCTWMMMWRMRRRASQFWTRSGDGFTCSEFRRCPYLK